MQTDTQHNLPLISHLKAIFTHSPVKMALFATQTARMVLANQAYLTAREADVGKHVSELVPPSVFHQVSEAFTHATLADLPITLVELPEVCEGVIHSYWNWIFTPIREEQDYILLTLIDVTSQVEARLQSEHAYQDLAILYKKDNQERRRLRYLEEILMSSRSASDPQTFAKTVLAAIDNCFSPQALALYSLHPEQHVFSLLSVHEQKDHKKITFPALIRCLEKLSPLEILNQLTSKLQKQWQGRETPPPQEPLAVEYIPLLGNSCEGVLVVALTGEERELLVQTLTECAPHLAGAMADTRLHAAISEEKQRLHTILNELPEGVVLVEARTGKVKYANPIAADMLGVDLQYLIGSPLSQSTPLTSDEIFSSPAKSIFRWNFALVHALWGKTVTNREVVINRPDGSEIIGLSCATPIYAPNGLITEAVMVFQDITALKRLERQKSEFFAVINHELRTPLTIILGFADLLRLQEDKEADAMYQYAIESIVQECEHLGHMMQELLDVSHMDQVKLSLQRKSQDLLALIKGAVTRHNSTTKTHDIHFIEEDVGTEKRIMGSVDALRIEQVINNLLTNAIKYSPGGGPIEVHVSPRYNSQGNMEEVYIWVKDEGIGMTARDLPHIFERFYRAETLSNSSISGFGIGLYLTKELVQAHGGRIWVESIKGQGSTFFVVLPLSGSQL